VAAAALCRQTLEVGAVCPNWARTDLCGGRLVTAVPTANAGRVRDGASYSGGRASESLQGRKPRLRARKVVPRALWEFECHGQGVCLGLGRSSEAREVEAARERAIHRVTPRELPDDSRGQQPNRASSCCRSYRRWLPGVTNICLLRKNSAFAPSCSATAARPCGPS
jgi:hypothetical protein